MAAIVTDADDGIWALVLLFLILSELIDHFRVVPESVAVSVPEVATPAQLAMFHPTEVAPVAPVTVPQFVPFAVTVTLTA
jgi:hypothetical protein